MYGTIIGDIVGSPYEEAIRLCVSMGADSDMLSAICGSIAEAYYGIPEHIQFEKRL